MNTRVLIQQGKGISIDEWRLQWRGWGTWLVGLFFLGVVLSEHPAFSAAGVSVGEAASVWADRVCIVGSLVAILTVPFALDRVRRRRVAPIEFSKPFEKAAYVLGKFAGAALPLFLMTILSMLVHLVITVLVMPERSFAAAGTAYLTQTLFIVFAPLFFAAGLTYCLSVYIRRPIIIIPLYLFYLVMTTVTQAAADAKFSWLSPIVRPDYFRYTIPAELEPTIWIHQIIYSSLSLGFLALAVCGFQRKQFLEETRSLVPWGQVRPPWMPRLGAKLRMLWGGQVIAALLMAFFALMNTLSNPVTDAVLLVEYAMFGLEFYLSVTGLLLLAGVLAHDKGAGVLDLVLTKPVNRWRLLGERLGPALTVYGGICLLTAVFLHGKYPSFPILKGFFVAFSTGTFLGFVGLTVANITQSALAGYGAGLLFWFFEAAIEGRFTAPFYLLIVSSQVHYAAGEVWRNPAIWLPVKIGSLILALWLFLFNGWLLDAGATRRRALMFLAGSMPVLYVLGWWLMPGCIR